jgi:O-antigen/teichoic acid export membrane protein
MVEPFFGTGHLLTDLRKRSVRGAAVTLVGQSARFVMQTGSTMALARLLTPADFGLISMVSVFTAFISLFKDLGLSMATVQRDKINHAQVSTLFWINFALSCGMMLLVGVLAPLVAWFYSEPRLFWVTLALAGTFIFSGLSVQHQALLNRQMRFISLALIEISSIASGIAVAITMALKDFGYWSLVGMAGATSVTNCVLAWSFCGWRPGLPQKAAGVREMLSFGTGLTGFNVLNYFARNLDKVLIGKVWGSNSLGIYSKAYELLMLPIQQITAPVAAVAIPALSRLQNDPVEYARYYYRAVNAIGFVTIPLIFFMAAFSRELVLFVLGDQWNAVAKIFKVLAFAGLLQPVVNPVGWVFISLGQTDRQMKWALVAVPATILSFLIGLPWGPLGVAVSYTICSLIVLTLPGLWWTFRYSPLTIKGWINSVRCPMFAGISSYITIEIIGSYFVSLAPLPLLAILGCTGVTSFILVVLVWKKAREEVSAAYHLLKHLTE